MKKSISVKNLPLGKDSKISLQIPLNTIFLLKGSIGSGKSTVCNTLNRESRRQVSQTLFSKASTEDPFTDTNELYINWLPPVVAVNLPQSESPITKALQSIKDSVARIFTSNSTFHCPQCKIPLKKTTVNQIVTDLLNSSEEILICAPYKGSIPQLINRGFYFHITGTKKERLKAEDKETQLYILVDRIEPETKRKDEITDSLNRSLGINPEMVRLVVGTTISDCWLQNRCSRCKKLYPQAPVALFDSIRNSCLSCKGRGINITIDPKKTFDLSSKNLKEAIIPLSFPILRHSIEDLFQEIPFKITGPIKSISKQKRDKLLKHIEGFLLNQQKKGIISGKFLRRFYSPKKCDNCGGSGVNPLRYAYSVEGKNIDQVMELSFSELSQLPYRDYFKSYEPQTYSLIQSLNSAGFGQLNSAELLNKPDITEKFIGELTVMDASTLKSTLIIGEVPHQLSIQQNNQVKKLLKNLKKKGNTILITSSNSSMDSLSDNIEELQNRRYLTPEGSSKPLEISFKDLYKQLQKSPHMLKGKTLISTTINLPEQFTKMAFQETQTVNISPPPAPFKKEKQTITDYFGITKELSNFFASLKASVDAGFTNSFFNPSSSRGKCPSCKKVPGNLNCEICNGTGFLPSITEIKIEGKSISDFLNMNIEELSLPQLPITSGFQTKIKDLGLGYLNLQAPIKSLSTGEQELLFLLKNSKTRNSSSYIFNLRKFHSSHPEDLKRFINFGNSICSSDDILITLLSDIPSGCKTDIIVRF